MTYSTVVLYDPNGRFTVLLLTQLHSMSASDCSTEPNPTFEVLSASITPSESKHPYNDVRASLKFKVNELVNNSKVRVGYTSMRCCDKRALYVHSIMFTDGDGSGNH